MSKPLSEQIILVTGATDGDGKGGRLELAWSPRTVVMPNPTQGVEQDAP